MTLIDLRTKPCPFCAETIQTRAVKCRFCNEFLNTEKARALESADSEPAEGDEGVDNILFEGRPSLLGMAWAVVKGSVVLVGAALLVKFPVEDLLGSRLAADQLAMIGSYRAAAGFGLGVLVVLILLIKAVRLKMVYYEVTADRIEWSRGILDRRVDNLDMFRVIDLKLRRNIFDCVFGIGSVALTTTDKSDPTFVFEKVRGSRLLYDVIKKASLEADRRTGVVHLE